MAITTSRHPIVKELLIALNLPYEDVSSFNLNIRPNEIITISVQLYLQDKYLGKIPGIVKRFYLAEIDEGEEHA